MSTHNREMPVPMETRLPAPWIPRDRVQLIFDCARAGMEMEDIAREVRRYMYGEKVPNGLAPYKRQVERVLNDPVGWNPDVDEIAVDRAYDGDREVWLGLTYYERKQCIDMLVETYASKPFHRHWADRPAADGIVAWAESVGEPPGRIKDINTRRKERERVVADRAA